MLNVNEWPKSSCLTAVVFSFLTSFSISAFSESGRADYDLDDDGLIEINDLADLNEIRNNLNGQTLYGENKGCPNAEDGTVNGGCKGFELTADLDFDTDGDGEITAVDDYWNDGSGWLPIGSSSQYFTAIFEGNGHVISKLYIDRADSYYIGLFGAINGGRIQRLILNGITVKGGRYVGGLVGSVADNNVLEANAVTGSIHASFTGAADAGGLVGSINENNTVKANLISGRVTADGSSVGGVASSARYNNIIVGNLSTAWVEGLISTGGIVNYSSLSSIFENNYWATDTSGQLSSHRANEVSSYVGLPLATLRCAVQANTTSENSECVSADGSAEGLNDSVTLFKGWDTYGAEDSDGVFQAYWEFGGEQQLPGLRLNGRLYRDSDGDGTSDVDDAFEFEYAAAKDQDSDGYPDAWTLDCDVQCQSNSGLQLDQFPVGNSAHLDVDLDGLPDAWNSSCDVSCRSESGLTLDTHFNDTDNDGVSDALDTDDNNDGITDADADSDGLIEISTLTQLNAMRHQLDGTGLRLTSDGLLNASGCPVVIYEGQLVNRCHGYELTADLDFDTDGDGEITAADDYWNDGSGWLPIGSSSQYFKATFEGNGHLINNLFIDRASSRYVGLFSVIDDARVQRLVLNNVNVKGKTEVGALVGDARNNNLLEANAVIGSIYASSGLYSANIGGLVGDMTGNNIVKANFVSGRVSAPKHVSSHSPGVGGLLNGGEYNNVVEGNLSTAWVIGPHRAGGFSGGFANHSSSSNTYENNYWATDISGQLSSYGANEVSSYVGLPLVALRCAVQANTTSHNSDCVSADGSAEGLNMAVTLFKGWDTYGAEDSDGVFQTYWEYGSHQKLPGLRLNGTLYQDSDGDGVLDADDAFEFEYAAAKDLDSDGYPDAWAIGCDTQCQSNSGLQLDQLPASNSAYLDADLDGLPDEWLVSCNQACQDSSGLVLDTSLNDTDNDGVSNDEDAFVNNAAASIDEDEDGLPDGWNDSCDGACQLASGLELDNDLDNDGIENSQDAFPTDIAASLDVDQDGLPDIWNENCNEACQLASDLELDVLLNDSDNDGVSDDLDPNNGQDNGAPVLSAVPGSMSGSVSNDEGSHILFTFNSHFIAGFDAYDAIDNNLYYEAVLNGELLEVDEFNQILLPAGLLSIEWTAIDDAGNRSNTIIQVVRVYPRVKFSLIESETGEPSSAEIQVELTGDAPDYPVVVQLAALESSDVSADDFAEGFSLANIKTVTIERGDDEAANRFGKLTIPVIDDGEVENDELLVVELQSAYHDEDAEEYFAVDDELNQHALTITYRNLVPTIEILMEQNGEAIDSIDPDGGAVRLSVEIKDGNGNDEHAIVWDASELGLTLNGSASVTFDPSNLDSGEATLSVSVTDNGLNPETVVESVLVTVEPTVRSGGSGGGSGGAFAYWLLVFMLLSARNTRKKSVHS